MKNIRRLLILFISIVLSCTVTWCWFFDVQKKPAYKLKMDLKEGIPVFNDDGLTLSVLKYNTDNSLSPVTPSSPLSVDGMLPGDSIRFRLQISNSTNAKSVKLILSNIECKYFGSDTNVKSTDILQYLYMIVIPEEGFVNSPNTDVVIPESKIVKLSDIISIDSDSEQTSSSIHNAIIYNTGVSQLIIPNTVSGNYVYLECRLWFDTSAVKCDNFSVKIGKIVLGL